MHLGVGGAFDCQLARKTGMDAICDEQTLPRPEFAEAWNTIKINKDVRTRLVAQALLGVQIRQRFTFAAICLHGDTVRQLRSE
jgi:hypothetical protein